MSLLHVPESIKFKNQIKLNCQKDTKLGKDNVLVVKVWCSKRTQIK